MAGKVSPPGRLAHIATADGLAGEWSRALVPGREGRCETSFEALGLPQFLLDAVHALGFEHPTPIQARAIGLVASGVDLAAEAQTGSGKTAAFAVPILQRLCAADERDKAVRVLVLAPTRELALQVAGAFKALGRVAEAPPEVLAIIGGESVDGQITALAAGAEIVVATPGRLLDLISHDQIDLTQLHTLVLDEADKLLDQGFAEELDCLLQAMPTERQSLLFSATLPARVLTLAERVLRDPVVVRIDEVRVPVEGIEQRVYEVNQDRRRGLLQHLLHAETWGQTLVFVATQRATENLAAKLRRDGVSAMALHGGLDQPERIRVLKSFTYGVVSVLVATDIAARGIDIPKLGTVVNFDLPRSTEGYVHRIGRTGRAGHRGLAVSFVDHDSAAHFRLIEQRNHILLTRQTVPGFELTGEAPVRTKGPQPVKGKRKSKKDKLREKAARDAQE